MLLGLGLNFGLLGQTFERSYGSPASERALAVTTAAPAGFLIVGSMESLPGTTGLLVVRTDSRGDTLWTRVFVDSGYQSEVCAAADDGAGGMVAVGKVRSQRADWDGWAVRVDSTGSPVWTQTWGAVGWDDCGLGVCRTWDGGWAVCGYTLQRRHPDVNVLRLAADGEKLWNVVTGTAAADYGYAIAATTDSVLLVAGTTVPPGSRYTDIYLLRFDSAGQLSWSRVVGDSLWDEARAVAVLPANGFAVAGFSSSFGTGIDCHVMRFDSSGQVLWQKTIGREVQSERAHGLAVTSNGGLLVVGESEPVAGGEADVYMAGISPQGIVCWERLSGRAGRDCAKAVSVLDDGGLAVIGETDVGFPNGRDFYFLRTDSLGGVGVRLPPAGRGRTPMSTLVARGSEVIAAGSARIIGSDGRVVKTLGSAEANWDGRDASGHLLGAGVFCIVTPDGQTRKIVRLD